MMASLLSHWTLSTPYALAVGIGAGALVGLFHFLSLKKNAGFYLEGNFGWALLLQCLRFAVLLVVFVALAKLGPWALPVPLAIIATAVALHLLSERRFRHTYRELTANRVVPTVGMLTLVLAGLVAGGGVTAIVAVLVLAAQHTPGAP